MSGDSAQLEILRIMGIKVVPMTDGRVQLLHNAVDATSPEDAGAGLLFMQDMINLAKQQASAADIKLDEVSSAQV